MDSHVARSRSDEAYRSAERESSSHLAVGRRCVGRRLALELDRETVAEEREVTGKCLDRGVGVKDLEWPSDFSAPFLAPTLDRELQMLDALCRPPLIKDMRLSLSKGIVLSSARAEEAPFGRNNPCFGARNVLSETERNCSFLLGREIGCIISSFLVLA